MMKLPVQVMQLMLRNAGTMRSIFGRAATAYSALGSKISPLKAAVLTTAGAAIAAYYGIDWKGDEASGQAVLDRLTASSEEVRAGAIQEMVCSAKPTDAERFLTALVEQADSEAERAAVRELAGCAVARASAVKHTGDGAPKAVSAMSYEMFKAHQAVIQEAEFATGLSIEGIAALRKALFMDQDIWDYVTARM